MKKPLYEQIYETYKKYIILGVYNAGDKLPSVREVGESMGVNPRTVNRAFLMLEEEGYVETVFKKGSFVKALDENNEIFKSLEKDLLTYKNNGIKLKDLNKIVKKVYGDNND